MASIVKLGSGKQPPRAIDFVDDSDDGKRKRIRLGIVTHDDAEEAKRRIEKLLVAKRLHLAPDNQTAEWLAGVGDGLHEKLAKHGLCPSRVRKDLVPTLGEFIDKHLSQRQNELKPASLAWLRRTGDSLVAHFGKTTRLDAVTPDGAKDWRATLAARGLAEATIRLQCRNAKTFFNDAVHRELIRRNPFASLKSTAVAAVRDRFVTMDEATKILEACPNGQWRLLFGLCRFAGLRCPSETHGLTWGNVDWARRRLTVYAPKTDSTRIMPIVPALLPLLQDAYDAAADGATTIITLSRNNLHRSFEAIVTRAGLVPWDDTFQTLRRSCESELALTNPQHAVSAWIGHSMKVSERHYLQVTDGLYDSAAGLDLSSASAPVLRAAESAAVGPRTVSFPVASGGASADGGKMTAHEKTPALLGENEHNRGWVGVRPPGLEPGTYGLKVRCSTN